MDSLQPDSLWSICVNSRRIRNLTITNSPTSDHSLLEAARCLENLEYLVLCGTEVSDWAIESLAVLVPRLKYIDIRNTTISTRMAARLVEGIREKGGRLQSMLVDDPGPFYESEQGLADHVAFKWLDWIGVLIDWIEKDRPRKESKAPWLSPYAIQSQRSRH